VKFIASHIDSSVSLLIKNYIFVGIEKREISIFSLDLSLMFIENLKVEKEANHHHHHHQQQHQNLSRSMKHTS
jgi:hypothetical protein